MCAKKLESEEDDLFIEDEDEEEAEFLPGILQDIDDPEKLELIKRVVSRKAQCKLESKRRLDAYMERKWFKEQGWDDDDELFFDEFFSSGRSLKQERI